MRLLGPLKAIGIHAGEREIAVAMDILRNSRSCSGLLLRNLFGNFLDKDPHYVSNTLNMVTSGEFLKREYGGVLETHRANSSFWGLSTNYAFLLGCQEND